MLGDEIRQAFRIYRRRPLIAATVIATLALGIGANSAIFGIVHAVLLRPLPYPDADRLVRVYHTYEVLKNAPNPRLQAIWNRLPMSYLNTLDWRRESQTLEGIGLFQDAVATLDVDGEPERVAGARIDADLLPVLGIEPALGRGFNEQEIEQGNRLVILGHGLWRELYGGDPKVVGESVPLDGEPHVVAGVMPAGFRIPGRVDDRLWIPLGVGEDDRQARDNFSYHALGRLAPGVSLEHAGEEMERIAAALADAYPESNDGTGVRLAPLLETLVGDSRPLLYLLLGAVALVLVVACVNVAHLLLAQAAARRRELAIRGALGADRRRLVRQLLLESLLLALAGGAAGLVLATFGQRALLAWIPVELPRREEIAIGGGVLAFTFGVSLLAALLSGLLPAWLSSRQAIREALGGGHAPGRWGRLPAHEGFMVLEIALTLMLTTVAGLLVHGFFRLSAVEPGFRTEGLLVQKIELPESYAAEHRRAAFADELLTTLERLPGAETAALTTKLPFRGPGLVWGFRLAGEDQESGKSWTEGRSAAMRFVSPDYFRTLEIPLLEGRIFSAGDRPDRGRVVIVNETLAARHWPRGDAVGRRVIMSAGDGVYEVIGVVADVRHEGLEAEPGELMYQPWSQQPGHDLFAVVATRGDPLELAPAVRRAIRGLDPTLPLAAATTVGEMLRQTLHAPRSRAGLVGALAALALFLALIGTYAVTSFAVDRRAPEIGVRMALGASAGGVRMLVLRRTLLLALSGVVLGTLAALGGARLLRALLFGVDAADPLIFAAAATLLLAVALAAGYLPARRASRVDPARTLRAE